MNPARDGAAAAFDASAEAAGTMASSIGSASVAPTPRRNVRRDRCILVMNIRPLVLSARCRRHLERYAANDTRNEGGKPVILAPGVPHDLSHGRHVLRREAAADGVDQQLFRQRADEHIR